MPLVIATLAVLMAVLAAVSIEFVLVAFFMSVLWAVSITVVVSISVAVLVAVSIVVLVAVTMAGSVAFLMAVLVKSSEDESVSVSMTVPDGG